MHIRKGDKVRVLSGEDKGKEGKVLKVFAGKKRAIVEGLNLIKRHTRPSSRNQQGGIIEKEAAIHISNLSVVCPGCGETAGVKRIRDEEGRLQRHCRACNETISTG